MRRFGVLLVFIYGLLLIGCEQHPSYAEQILGGEHRLRKMIGQTEANVSLSGGFFLFVGDISGRVTTGVSVKFAWEMNDGTYAISSLPLEKIRIKLDEKATTPTIKFRWSPSSSKQVQDLMDWNVLYAIITAREADWPVQVNLPLNQ